MNNRYRWTYPIVRRHKGGICWRSRPSIRTSFISRIAFDLFHILCCLLRTSFFASTSSSNVITILLSNIIFVNKQRNDSQRETISFIVHSPTPFTSSQYSSSWKLPTAVNSEMVSEKGTTHFLHEETCGNISIADQHIIFMSMLFISFLFYDGQCGDHHWEAFCSLLPSSEAVSCSAVLSQI